MYAVYIYDKATHDLIDYHEHSSAEACHDHIKSVISNKKLATEDISIEAYNGFGMPVELDSE